MDSNLVPQSTTDESTDPWAADRMRVTCEVLADVLHDLMLTYYPHLLDCEA
jgi:hypothetical protein